MGTKIDCKSYMPVYCSMRDLNEDSSSSSWPVFCGDKTIPNGQYYDGFVTTTTMGGHLGFDKDALKQKILEHEMVFKNQVYELHRLYSIQRDMMEEVRRKELLHRLRDSMELSSSSSIPGSQAPPQDAQKWHMAGFPLRNSEYGRASTSGIEIVNSPLSCTKESKRLPGQLRSQNGSNSRDTEALDSRTLKVRKKSFDLHLPADEYIDTEEGEKFTEVKVSNLSSYTPKGNLITRPESSRMLSLGSQAGREADYRLDPSASASCLRNPTGLADLNEPIQIEETITSSAICFLDHVSSNGEAKGINKPIKSSAVHPGINNKGTVHLGNGFSINSVARVNETGHLSRLYEAGPSNKINFNSSSCVLEQVKLPAPSHRVQAMPKRADHPSEIYPIGYSREVLWREGRESSNKRHSGSDNGPLEPLMASQSYFPSSGSSCLNGSWAHSVSSWAKGKTSFSHSVPAMESSSHSAAAANRTLENSAQSQGPFGGNWRTSACAGLNLRAEGFYHGSALGAKELKVCLPSTGFDCLNDNKANNGAPDYLITRVSGNFSKGSCHVDSKPALNIDLNEVVSKGSLDEAGIPRDQTLIDEQTRPKDHLSSLRWLSCKAAHRDATANTGKSELSGDLNKIHASSNCDRETIRDLNQPLSPKTMSDSSDCEIVMKKESFEVSNVKKLLGFPIFETGSLVKEVSALEGNNVVNERKNRMIDINLECEPDEQVCEDDLIVEKKNQTNGDCFRECIDLNSCASEGQDFLAPSHECKAINGKVALEIDLETSVPLDDDGTQSNVNMVDKAAVEPLEKKNNDSQDEVLRNAAEVVVSISLFCPEIDAANRIFCEPETSLADSLLWFVDALLSCPDALDISSGRELLLLGDPQKELDEFEATTLQLAETKEEDYMPSPLIPEVETMEETGSIAVASRSRRGQSRRGRQRKDFQRDILPGLVSLSRHEVTEDLQIFGSLMRATGHQWASGLTRRNGTRTGGARGRRRIAVEVPPIPTCSPLVQQLSSIEAGLEDRSLTGWGKTTRRPRRQRCPGGNPPTIVLT